MLPSLQDKKPLNKKQQEEKIVESIDRLTEFYNALSDDANMSYIIDALDEIHDREVHLDTHLTLLREEFLSFEKIFDEKNDFTNEALDRIRETAITAVRQSILGYIQEDVVALEKFIKSSRANHKVELERLMDEAEAKIEKNNRIVVSETIHKRQFNFIGTGILLLGVLLLGLNIFFMLDNIYVSQQFKQYDEKIFYVKQQNDRRFEEIKEVLFELSQKNGA